MSFIIKVPDDKIRAKDAIDSIAFSPVQIVRIEDYKRNRSTAQNRTLHKWLSLIAQHTGYSLEEVKDKVVLSIWPPVSREITVRSNGNPVTHTLIERRSTASMSVEEMTQLLNAVVIVADQLDIVLPFDDEYKDSMK